MPNSIGSTGLTTATQTELVTQFTAAFQAIYGSQINLAQNSPDGQMMMNFIQSVLDLLNLLTQIYNMFDPDNAIGVILDQRVAINGIQRQAGTYTIQSVSVTVAANSSVNLYGLDQTAQSVFTVADQAGNEYNLTATQLGVTAGTYSLVFQSALPGAVQSAPNTITVPVSVILGVSAVNNPTTYTTLGINEESDVQLKVRRQQSVAMPSQGYYNGLVAGLLNITGVTSAFVYENLTGLVDANGTPGHSIWVIVAGSGANASIAQAIYNYRNAGCGMKGSISYVITQVDGTSFSVFWDTVALETLYIAFTATSVDGVNAPKISQIISQLPTIFTPGVAAEVNINQLATFIQQIDSNCLVTNAGFSSVGNTGPYTNTLSPTAKNLQFTIASANIIVIPIILSPAIVNVPRGITQQFTPNGGIPTYTYSLLVNNSGATINTGTGLYTAGVSTGIDTVKVIDGQGNIATATVTVT